MMSRRRGEQPSAVAAAVPAWKVGTDQSGANEEVNGLGCLYLSLLSAYSRAYAAKICTLKR
jgi:hypothetical protein